jgi:hypothetical protein
VARAEDREPRFVAANLANDGEQFVCLLRHISWNSAAGPRQNRDCLETGNHSTSCQPAVDGVAGRAPTGGKGPARPERLSFAAAPSLDASVSL